MYLLHNNCKSYIRQGSFSKIDSFNSDSMYKYSEEKLVSFTKPLSQTETNKAENSINMIKSAIIDSPILSNMDIEIFCQGSYANDTNVKSESDVDVCVMCKDVFHPIFSNGINKSFYKFKSCNFNFHDFRNHVLKAIQQKFGCNSVDGSGNKSIKIDENTYHIKADVVPALQLRNYTNSYDFSSFEEGTWIFANDGKITINYPKIHIDNGKEKNKHTNLYYKKLVRVMKHIKNDMIEDGIADKRKISSFLVESLIWNIPNSIITGYCNWNDRVKAVIIYLLEEIEDERFTGWNEVSEKLALFSNDRKWNANDVKSWLGKAWYYLGY